MAFAKQFGRYCVTVSLLLTPCVAVAQQDEPCSQPTVTRDATLPGVCDFVLHLQSTMPNFVALQSTARYAAVKTMPSLAPADTLSATVSHVDGHDSYTELRRNGNPVSRELSTATGVWSLGEFSDQLRSVFATQNQATFGEPEVKKVNGRLVKVYPFTLLEENNHSPSVNVGTKSVLPGYRGKLSVDEQTSKPIRLTLETIALPKKFPVKSALIEIDYAETPLADGTHFSLPRTASVTLCLPHDDGCSRNVTTFSDFRKFRSSTRIISTLPAGDPKN
jgi:hypothetical protein